MFLKRKIDHQQTIFTTHSTTNSPQKHHHFVVQFGKNPCKKRRSTTPGKDRRLRLIQIAP